MTAATAAGTANVATSNTNTFLNITEKVGAATASAGTSTQITGAGTVTVGSDAAGKITITGAQSITGNASTATKLQTPRAINGVNFDGSANITVADSTKLPLTGGRITGDLIVNETITVEGDNTVGMFKKLIQCATTTDGGYLAVGNTASDKGYVEIGTVDDADTEIVARKRTSANAILATVKILDQSNNSSFPGTVLAPTFSGALNGNAATATRLQTPQAINGVNFDGTAAINLPLIGYGQTWQDVTALRARDTVYINSTGAPIMISIYGETAGRSLSISTNGVDWLNVGGLGGSGDRETISLIVPNGHRYMLAGSINLDYWVELR